MRSRVFLLTAMLLAVLCVSALALEDAEVPKTVVRVTGRKAVSYPFFGVLAAFCLLLIYRGIRAR
jgi:hypothetical protein